MPAMVASISTGVTKRHLAPAEAESLLGIFDPARESIVVMDVRSINAVVWGDEFLSGLVVE
jgi:hypothetical protein